MSKKMLVLSSGFTRGPDDMQYEKDFVVVLSRKMADHFDLIALAPRDRGSSKIEKSGAIRIFRHRQCIIPQRGLAYGSGIIENIRKNRWLMSIIPFFLFFQFSAILKLLRRERVDIIHAHWIIPQGLTAVLAKKLLRRDIRVMVTVHGSDYWRFNRIWGHGIIRFVLKHADAITAVSGILKSELTRLYPRKPIFVYPMGVDTDRFRPLAVDNNLKGRLAIKGHCLLFIGYVTEAKGVPDLIQAVSRIKPTDPLIRLLIIGDGNQLNDMKELVTRLNLDENVAFLGRVENEQLPKYYALADLFVLPSQSEGLPLVVMEALSTGTLTIVSDLPGFIPLMRDEVLFCFKKGNIQALADRILEILSDLRSHDKMRTRARYYARSRFDWTHVVENYASLAETVLDQTGSINYSRRQLPDDGSDRPLPRRQ